MQRRSSVVLLVLVVFAGAGAIVTSAQAARGSASQGATAKFKEDFSTPRAAVETFFAAAAARDADVLSRCFSEDSPREFESARKKQIPSEGLDHLAKEFGVGKVVDVKQNETKAVVEVKLNSRDETIHMVMTVGGWKIRDF